MTRDVWLARHPYLKPIADLHVVVDSLTNEMVVPTLVIPDWKDYVEDFVAGVPLLQSSRASIDLRPAESLLVSMVQRLASRGLLRKLDEQTQGLARELSACHDSSLGAVAWLVDKNSFSTSQPGLLQYFGWAVLSRYLSTVLAAFANWRDEERWLRNYCPTCGSAPAMALLVGTDPGRLRLFSCGCCTTRWRYRRTQCPFCEKDEHRLSGYSVEGSPLRIDYCKACGGYLKTYHGEGTETPLLADWMSIHLDILAADRGLQRFARSLYHF